MPSNPREALARPVDVLKKLQVPFGWRWVKLNKGLFLNVTLNSERTQGVNCLTQDPQTPVLGTPLTAPGLGFLVRTTEIMIVS